VGHVAEEGGRGQKVMVVKEKIQKNKMRVKERREGKKEGNQ
jgi:hypothetical protein